MTNQRGGCLAQGEGNAELPEYGPRHDRAASGVAAKTDGTFLTTTGRLGDVVQQGGEKEDMTCWFIEDSPRRQRRQRLTDHARVRPYVAFRVIDAVLRTTRQV